MPGALLPWLRVSLHFVFHLLLLASNSVAGDATAALTYFVHILDSWVCGACVDDVAGVSRVPSARSICLTGNFPQLIPQGVILRLSSWKLMLSA